MDELLRTLATRSERWYAGEIVVNVALAFLLGLFVAWVYRATHRQLSVSFSFVNMLVLVSMLMSMVMMVIGNNIARAFGLAGAMSIIRFRTVVKDTRDTAFVFYALGVGMACGTGNLKIALIGTFLIGLFAGVLHWTRHGAAADEDFLVTFSMLPSDDLDDTKIYRPLLEKYCSAYHLVSVKSERLGENIRLTFQASLKDPRESEIFVSELSNLEGVQRVTVAFGEEASD
jgi:uncharacterized membrane protein YhiD involved in acid resistance